MSGSLKFEDGRYTIVGIDSGNLHCLRYGEEWRSLAGDKLVYMMAYEIRELRELVERQKETADEDLRYMRKMEEKIEKER